MQDDMNRQDIESAIETIQDKVTNIKILLAVPMAVIMCVYFFTYGTLIDMGYKGILYFEISSSIIFFLILFNLNVVGYRLVKFRLASKPKYKTLFTRLSSKTINTPLATLTDQIENEMRAQASEH